ncbi:unnamed protein product [Brachionus calyciflorus]|uniref:Tetratricopeptide repeat protein 17 n=1 Tax=Brachionus calyciflorus TaxID=104777 RepID=A0A814A424_9BILA|nr:unnamed protein product [Brachionus calyciflorus]
MFRTKILFFLIVLKGFVSCSTHWRVTEEGRIEVKDDTVFTLLRPYDLASFMKQSDRLTRLDHLKNLIQNKEIPSTHKDPPVSVTSYQENFYKTDPDCLKAEQQLTKFSFYETHLISWHTHGLYLPKESLDIKRSQVKLFKKPFCDIVSLPFNMKTFDHLDSIQSKENITMLPETDLLANILIEPEDFYGHLIHVALLTNSTSWVYLAMAGDFFRIKGDFLNAVKCLQRSIFYAPDVHQTVPILSLSNMLHKLHFINDSLAIALTGAAMEPNNSIFSYYLGNIYVTLGDLNSAYEWYDKAVRLDSEFRQALLKKYAVMCHIKLEEYLEDQHDNLQKKLDELKDYQSYSDEWFHLNSKIELEKSSSNRKEITTSIYNNLLYNTISKICSWNNDNNNNNMECKNLQIHYSYFPFNNQTLIQKLENSNLFQNENTQSTSLSSSSDSKPEVPLLIQNEKSIQTSIKPPTTRDFLLSNFT